MIEDNPKRGFERHSLGTQARIDTYVATVKELEAQLQDQCNLATVGFLAIDPLEKWPTACREDKTQLYFIFREDGCYWTGKVWSDIRDDDHETFAATYGFEEAVKLLQKRFWRGFPAKDVAGKPIWMRPPSLVPVR